MTFTQYAAAQGVKMTDPLIDIVDCATDFYERANPLPTSDDDYFAWYERANAFADRMADKYAR